MAQSGEGGPTRPEARDDDIAVVLMGLFGPALVMALLGLWPRSVATDGNLLWLGLATVAFYGGVCALVGSLLEEARSTLVRIAVLVPSALVAVPLLALETAQAGFVWVTGAALGPELLLYGLRAIDDALLVLWKVVGTGPGLLLVLHFAVIVVLVLRTRVYAAPSRPRRRRNSRAMALAAVASMSLPSAVGPGSLPVMRMPGVVYMTTGLFRTTPPLPPADLPDELPDPVVRKLREGSPPNLVIVMLESTSWSSTTLADPKLLTTPYLAELAATSLVAHRAHTVVPHTTKASVAVVCGYSPRHTIEVTESEPDGLHHPCLPHLLRPFGYESAFFRSATGLFEGWNQLLRYEGFDHVVVSEDLEPADWHRVNLFGFEDDILLEPSREWLEKRGGRPFLAVYLTGTPHYEYALPDEHVVERFADQDDHNRHLNGIRYVDDFLRKLVQQYQELGLYEDTVFLIVGDHGEAFGEHGRWQHDSVPWDEVARVPLVLHVPGREWDRPVVREGVSQLDVVPTLLDLAGFELEGEPYEGMPIHEVREERRLFFHCWYPSMCVASMRGPRKVIDHQDLRPLELFDRDADPAERVNLAADAPEEIRAEIAEMQRWRARVEAFYEQRRRRPMKLDEMVRHEEASPEDGLVARPDPEDAAL